MSYNQTDFSLEHYCNGQKFHLGSDGSCHLQNPAGLCRNLLEEERIKNGSLLKEIKKVKMIKKENLVGFNGHRNSKKYWIDQGQHKFYQLPGERKKMSLCKPCKILLHTFGTYSFCFLFRSLIGPFTEP